jgi:hypothetical protein
MDLEAKVDAILRHMAATCSFCYGAGRVYKAVMKDGPDGTTVPAEKDCPACSEIRTIPPGGC